MRHSGIALLYGYYSYISFRLYCISRACSYRKSALHGEEFCKCHANVRELHDAGEWLATVNNCLAERSAFAVF